MWTQGAEPALGSIVAPENIHIGCVDCEAVKPFTFPSHFLNLGVIS